MKNVIYLLTAMVFCLGFCRCTNDDDDEVYPRNQILGEYTGTSQAYLLKDGKIGEKELWYKDITVAITPMEKIDANFIITVDAKTKHEYKISCNGYQFDADSASFAVENQSFKINDVEYVGTGEEIKKGKGAYDGIFINKDKQIEMRVSMRKKNAAEGEAPILVKYQLTKK